MVAEHAHGGLKLSVDEDRGRRSRRGGAKHGGGPDEELPGLGDGGKVTEGGAGGVRHRHGRRCKCDAEAFSRTSPSQRASTGLQSCVPVHFTRRAPE